MEGSSFEAARILSPRRKSTDAHDIPSLVAEQLKHFGVDPSSDFGRTLSSLSTKLYESQTDIQSLWNLTLRTIDSLDKRDRISYFNAKKFLSFQLAKLLDTLQNPARKAYQSLDFGLSTQSAKGPYAPFDNVTAVFSANPVITRTATYIYACAEWIEDAFQGKEMMLEMYSRMLNPTSVALANYIVDVECGSYANGYFAWNFNSGMAAIDAVLSHVLGREDIVITSQNIYGGAHQLLHDWFAKPSNLQVALDHFEGYHASDFLKTLERVKKKYADRLAAGRKIYLYIESPCNPHGHVLDVAGICREAHREGIRVMLDATVGTPFLYRPFQRVNPAERPDFIIHSYTKDLSGLGSVIAGVVIGRNEDMFIPKGQSMNGVSWEHSMFWNVYYVKGAFLNADAAFEVIQGMKTLDVRMLTKCVNTIALARFLASHPQIRVNCNALETDRNTALREKHLFLGLAAPLFTADFGDVPRDSFQRFFDNLSPTFGHMISLGQSNTIIACPALTTHSELSDDALRAAGISPTMIRFAMGDEDPMDLITHLTEAARLTIDAEVPGFADQFMTIDDARRMVRHVYLDVHQRYIDSKLDRIPAGTSKQLSAV